MLVLYVPSGQEVQLTLRTRLNVFAGQATGDSEVSLQKWPEGHGLHAVERGLAAYVPVLQAMGSKMGLGQ